MSSRVCCLRTVPGEEAAVFLEFLLLHPVPSMTHCQSLPEVNPSSPAAPESGCTLPAHPNSDLHPPALSCETPPCSLQAGYRSAVKSEPSLTLLGAQRVMWVWLWTYTERG